jgi:predicted Zn-ribbon and HTH transcriptional regulator
MPTVADALRQHADGYLNLYRERMPTEHKRVLAAITRCRTGALGHLRYDCRSCRHTHWVGRSCGNRHCPNCQSDKTQVWLAKRTAQLLPVPYFLVTFTVPEALRKIVRANQRDCYKTLFDTGSQTIRELASGKRFIGTDRLGFFGALHTWGRDPTVYHPHVHFVVPGGGVSADGSRWQAGPANYLLPEKAASKVYRAKFRDAMREAGLLEEIDSKVWKQTWVVDIEAVGDGRATLKYLAPYVYRAAISNNRIVDVDESSVTYRVTPSGSKRSTSRCVSGNEFVRGFLQHSLPRNFQRLRYYGFASPNSKLKFAWVYMLVCFYLGWCYWLAKQAEPEPIVKPPVRCPKCRGEMQLTAITDGSGRILCSHPLPYLDSG